MLFAAFIAPKRVIAIAIACDIHGTLPAKSRLGRLLEYGCKGYWL
jgi:hypothetical protein